MPVGAKGQHDMKPHGSEQGFDATTLKSKFPSLADASLHYLDNAATAQMPEIVLGALRQFELEARPMCTRACIGSGAPPRQRM